MALTKYDLRPNWSPRRAKKKNVKGEKKRRGRGRRRRGRRRDQGQKGMETHLDYEFYEIWHGSLVLYDYYLAQT